MVAKTYGVLPSYVRDHATTYDIMVMDVYMAWEDYQRAQAEGSTVVPNVEEDVLMDMMRNVRGEDYGRRN